MGVQTTIEEVARVLLELRWCGQCQDERGFESPECEDGHGLDCLDLACVECGHAIVVGVMASEVVLVEYAAA